MIWFTQPNQRHAEPKRLTQAVRRGATWASVSPLKHDQTHLYLYLHEQGTPWRESQLKGNVMCLLGLFTASLTVDEWNDSHKPQNSTFPPVYHTLHMQLCLVVLDMKYFTYLHI